MTFIGLDLFPKQRPKTCREQKRLDFPGARSHPSAIGAPASKESGNA
jgi:hypothetical protein